MFCMLYFWMMSGGQGGSGIRSGFKGGFFAEAAIFI